jgi:hypothetical protein
MAWDFELGSLAGSYPLGRDLITTQFARVTLDRPGRKLYISRSSGWNSSGDQWHPIVDVYQINGSN